MTTKEESRIARLTLSVIDEVSTIGTPWLSLSRQRWAYPLREVYRTTKRRVPRVAPVTNARRHLCRYIYFEDALHGRAEEYLEWLDPVEVPAEADEPSKVSS
jgi:hypothetical protein